ncbi:hypothetical protein, partial [Escherichia coli]|uniref:hypothetical protein n=1 Tax=Escherichia coli TaxID=562 RepID=UPI00338DDAE0
TVLILQQLVRLLAHLFLCTENPQLGWGFRKAFSFEPVIKTLNRFLARISFPACALIISATPAGTSAAV